MVDSPTHPVSPDEEPEGERAPRANPGGQPAPGGQPLPPTHPGGEREDILRARPVPREASSQEGQWASGHSPGTRKDRKVRSHRKAT